MKKILIANRGEIACRIIESCKKLKLHSIAVYSDADNKSKHVRLADESICIGSSKAKESYLSSENILNAAIKTKADAATPSWQKKTNGTAMTPYDPNQTTFDWRYNGEWRKAKVQPKDDYADITVKEYIEMEVGEILDIKIIVYI